MSDSSLPVEGKHSIVGTGMSADHESIQELQDKWSRSERVSIKPYKTFKKVLNEKQLDKPKAKKVDKKKAESSPARK